MSIYIFDFSATSIAYAKTTALKPGGCFLFDVLNENWAGQKPVAKTWEIAEQDFWREKPYLLLSETFTYPANKVILYQHCVISQGEDDEEDCQTYRFWTHFFPHEDLTEILSKRFRSKHKLPKGDASVLDFVWPQGGNYPPSTWQ